LHCILLTSKIINIMKGKIGTNAGIVWETLSNGEKLEIKALKKAVKLAEKDLYAALGWLAREEKIFFEGDDEIVVGLI